MPLVSKSYTMGNVIPSYDLLILNDEERFLFRPFGLISRDTHLETEEDFVEIFQTPGGLLILAGTFAGCARLSVGYPYQRCGARNDSAATKPYTGPPWAIIAIATAATF